MKKFTLWFINIYHATKPVRIGFSQTIFGSDASCRFSPTCSKYAEQSIKKHGAFRGSLFALWRVLRCNPLFKPGYDPVK